MKKSFQLTSLLCSMFVVLAVSCQTEKLSNESKLCSAEEFESGMNQVNDKYILDVRTPEEFASGFISGAKLYNIYDSDFTSRVAKLDKKKPVFVYCKGGGRSAQAAEQFISMGFEKVYDLKGGIMAWENSGRKITNSTEPSEKKIKPKANHLYTKAEFDSLVSTGRPLLINFYAKWCAPCKKMDPILDELSKINGNDKLIYRVDVDDSKELCKSLRIDGPPVLKLFKDSKEIKSINGFQDKKQLEELLREIK